MDLHFRDRKHKVIAVDPSAGSRTLLTEVIRSVGFADAQAVPNLKDALGIIEVEPVSWILTSVFPDQETNLMQMLRLCHTVPELQNLRISAFVEENEMEILPAAFEHGLLSYHRKPFTKDYLKQELESILADFEKCQWSSSLLASNYLRKCLIAMNGFEDLLGFEKQLLLNQPGNFQQMLNLVIPLAKLQKTDEAKAILGQVQRLEPSLEKQVKAIQSTHLNNADLSDAKGSINVLGLKTAVVVDNDSVIQNDAKIALQEMGVEDIQIFSDGKSAMDFIKEKGNPDVVIHEWKIPKLTGPLFLQKAREELGQTTPFILYSGLIDKADAPFIREMGVSHVISKPMQRTDLIKNIIWTVQQERIPTEKSSMERKIRQFLSNKQLDKAEPLVQKYLGDTNISIGARQLIEAEVSYAKGQYEKARDLTVESLKNAGDSIFVLNLLGKIMLQLRDLDTALKCFQKAQNLAPQNMERLCQIAEIEAEIGENEKSDATLGKVDDMDPGSEKAKETKAKIAINSGDSMSAKQIMNKLRAVENIVSYMNNKAIAMARCGKVEEGIEQYKKTIEAIPEERPDMLAVVQFNLALAYLRAGMVDDAKSYLTTCSQSTSLRMQERALKLLKKIKAAQAQGLPVQMVAEAKASTAAGAGASAAAAASVDETADAKRAVGESGQQAAAAAVEYRAGDHCCYLIYRSVNPAPSSVTKMLEGTLRFTARSAITRSESAGADKLNASGN